MASRGIGRLTRSHDVPVALMIVVQPNVILLGRVSDGGGVPFGQSAEMGAGETPQPVPEQPVRSNAREETRGVRKSQKDRCGDACEDRPTLEAQQENSDAEDYNVADDSGARLPVQLAVDEVQQVQGDAEGGHQRRAPGGPAGTGNRGGSHAGGVVCVVSEGQASNGNTARFRIPRQATARPDWVRKTKRDGRPCRGQKTATVIYGLLAGHSSAVPGRRRD